MIPADRSRFEYVAEQVVSANFAGSTLPTPPASTVNLRTIFPPFTHIEIVPLVSQVNCVWFIQASQGSGGTFPLDLAIQQGSPDSTPTETVIQPTPPGAAILSLDAVPFGGALGALPYFALLRVYRVREFP